MIPFFYYMFLLKFVLFNKASLKHSNVCGIGCDKIVPDAYNCSATKNK